MARIADRRQDRRRPSRIFSLPDRAPGPSAADDPARGILTTEISPALARTMTIAFVVAIVAVPIFQAAAELSRHGRIQALDVFRSPPTHPNLAKFEKDLTRESIPRKLVQPRLQAALSGALGFGTTQVIPGRDGWLFFRPGIDWVAGPGLLDPARLRHHARELADSGVARPAPDPLAAIRAYHEECRRAGVRLVILPVPDKVSIEAHRLSSRFGADGSYEPPTNVDYGRFIEELRSSGVNVFDPTPEAVDPDGPDLFLEHDSHWTPEWMEEVARGLAEHLKEALPTIPGAPRSWRVDPTPVSRVGDIAQMLQLDDGQRLYPPQSVTIHRVRDAASGGSFRPVEGASVVLLGDSFSNIYTSPDLGWGDSAGLPAQLARCLGRDVDAIARNGADAQAIWAEFARRPDPLGGRAAIVWEFAARKLTRAHWGTVPIGAPRPSAARSEPAVAEALVVEATVLATSRVPEPYAVPYKDCLTYTKLRVDRVVGGTYADPELIAVFWGMRDNVRLPAADYAAGARLRLKLVPLRRARAELQTARSADNLEDYEHSPYFVLEEKGL